MSELELKTINIYMSIEALDFWATREEWVFYQKLH